TVHSAQERYHARQGQYADALTKLDTKMPPPTYFTAGTIAVPSTATSLETGWELPLTRTGASAGYGAYTVIFNEEGFDKTNSTIPDEITPFQTATSRRAREPASSPHARDEAVPCCATISPDRRGRSCGDARAPHRSFFPSSSPRVPPLSSTRREPH